MILGGSGTSSGSTARSREGFFVDIGGTSLSIANAVCASKICLVVRTALRPWNHMVQRRRSVCVVMRLAVNQLGTKPASPPIALVKSDPALERDPVPLRAIWVVDTDRATSTRLHGSGISPLLRGHLRPALIAPATSPVRVRLAAITTLSSSRSKAPRATPKQLPASGTRGIWATGHDQSPRSKTKKMPERYFGKPRRPFSRVLGGYSPWWLSEAFRVLVECA